MAIKYKWLAGHLREQLPDYTANGIHRLPTEAAISQRYKVSRQTVRQALSVLEQEGLIEKRQGSGSYITGRSRGEDRIDLLLSSDSAYLYPMLLHDIKKTLAAQGFSTTVHITENTFSTEHTLLQKILHQPPRALESLWKDPEVICRIRIWICTVNCRKRNALFSFYRNPIRN